MGFDFFKSARALISCTVARIAQHMDPGALEPFSWTYSFNMVLKAWGLWNPKAKVGSRLLDQMWAGIIIRGLVLLWALGKLGALEPNS